MKNKNYYCKFFEDNYYHPKECSSQCRSCNKKILADKVVILLNEFSETKEDSEVRSYLYQVVYESQFTELSHRIADIIIESNTTNL